MENLKLWDYSNTTPKTAHKRYKHKYKLTAKAKIVYSNIVGVTLAAIIFTILTHMAVDCMFM